MGSKRCLYEINSLGNQACSSLVRHEYLGIKLVSSPIVKPAATRIFLIPRYQSHGQP